MDREIPKEQGTSLDGDAEQAAKEIHRCHKLGLREPERGLTQFPRRVHVQNFSPLGNGSRKDLRAVLLEEGAGAVLLWLSRP